MPESYAESWVIQMLVLVGFTFHMDLITVHSLSGWKMFTAVETKSLWLTVTFTEDGVVVALAIIMMWECHV